MKLDKWLKEIEKRFEVINVKKDTAIGGSEWIWFSIKDIPNWLFSLTNNYAHIYKNSTFCFFGEHYNLIDKFRPSDSRFCFFDECFGIGLNQIDDIIKNKELKENYDNFFETDYNKKWIHVKD